MSGLDFSQASALLAAGETFVMNGIDVSSLVWTDTTTDVGGPSITVYLEDTPVFTVLPAGIMLWQGRGGPSPHVRAAVLARALDLPRPWFTAERRVLRFRGHVVPAEGLAIDSMGRVLI